jgi:hypothetical protein
MIYLVVVRNQGNYIAEHTVEAADALTAINQVEREYGEPPQVEFTTVELEDGHKRHLMLVNNWHGYAFHARPIAVNSDDIRHFGPG